MKLVGLKTKQMADEGRSSTIVVDSRLEKIFSPFGPETPSSSSLHQLEKEPCYKKAMHEGKALVEKQKIKFQKLLSLLRGIQPQVNSRQENIRESLSDHRVHLQKVFQQAIRHLCLIQQTSPTSEASLVATHKQLQTIFQHVQFSLTSIGDGVEDLITSLTQHMCIPMTDYVKSLKSELTGGSLIHLVALVEEMEGVMRDKELELEEARRKMRVEEEKKMEALRRLKDANEKEGPWQSLLGSFWRPNESQRIILLHNRKKKKFTGFRLWTFPIIVDGPFGVVSAAEFIGIMFFTAYVIWAVSLYTIQNLDLLSKYELPSRVKSSMLLKLSGLRFGSIGLICLAFLFLPVARGSILLRLIDIPFEHATRYHVWLGHLTMVIFTLHGAFYLLAWTMDGRLLAEMTQWKNAGIANLPGVISLFAGLLMWVTSLHPVRKNYFELFFYTHQLYVVFAVFFALHVGDFVFSIAAAGMFLFLLDRFLRFCQSRKTVKLVSATCLPCGTLELVLTKPAYMRYNALSFVFLQIRELSWLQWHPFSVSSSPLDGKHHISVLIKVLGQWTKELGDRISSTHADPMQELPSQPYCRITASVEGPYGHESAYHLTYRNLILVAGGIGISPFLAVLRDILHHIAMKKPCIPEKILIVWAVKRSKELSLLLSFDVESICPFYSDNLLLEVQTYVTQESDPPLEDGEVCKSMNCNYFPSAKDGCISGLVGTGNNIWSGIYVLASTIGFIIFMALVEIFYIRPSGISFGWFTGLVFVACMIASVVTFGALVVVLWHLWERRDSSYEKQHMEYDNKSEEEQLKDPVTYTDTNSKTLGSLSTIRYGCRPNFQEIFSSVSDSWGHVDVGVIVCGPPTLQTSVAKECRSQNLKGKKNQAFFHFNSHSFDL